MISAFWRWIGQPLIPLCLSLVHAQALADETVLSVYPEGVKTPIVWDLAQLRALPPIEIETTTPFTDGPQRFVGVSLRQLLGEVNDTAILSLRAVNDYEVAIPVAEINQQFPIIAYLRNGSEMSVRDKGPLWVIYPFDSQPEYQNESTFSRSIWQLVEIRVGGG